MKKSFCTIVLLLSSYGAHAQATLNPTAFLATSNHIVAMLDQNQAGLVWDGASPKLKVQMSRENFVRTISDRRNVLGTPANRDWVSINRVHVAVSSQTVPAGEYITVNEVGSGRNGFQLHEAISFTVDSDNTWRLVGYVIQ